MIGENVMLKKLVILVLSVFCVSVVSADCQYNQQGQYMHVPYDRENTDNESYVGSIPVNNNLVYEEIGGRANLQQVALEVITSGSCDRVPHQLADLEINEQVEVSGGNTLGETCLLTDVNGDTRTTLGWTARTARIEPLVTGGLEDLCYYSVYLEVF